MKGRVDKMCKYARNDMFKVSTPQQMKIIMEVLKSETSNVRVDVDKPKFNAALWNKNTNDTNTISKK